MTSNRSLQNFADLPTPTPEFTIAKHLIWRNKMRRTFSAALILLFALAGCKAKEAYHKAKISQDLDQRGTRDLMKDVSKDRYTPRSDGKLTDGQMQLYLKAGGQEK